VKSFPNLGPGLQGFTDHALGMHLSLYVREAADFERLAGVNRMLTPVESPKVSALRNAIHLHEAFFGNLVRGGAPPSPSFALRIKESFGSFEMMTQALTTAVNNAGESGWGVLCETDALSQLEVISIRGHAEGSPFGRRILFALDGFEHAYWTDFGPAKISYLTTVLLQVDWRAVESRTLPTPSAGPPP